MTSDNGDAIRTVVRDRYAEAARSAGSCCGEPGPQPVGFGATHYDAAEAASLPEAALTISLGCGNPTALATLEPGQVVLDLGSGGGIDISCRRVGSGPPARSTAST